jgi:hypothetical protein
VRSAGERRPVVLLIAALAVGGLAGALLPPDVACGGPVAGDAAVAELTVVGGVLAFPREFAVAVSERLSPAASGGLRVAWPARRPAALELYANRGFGRTASPADRATSDWQAGGDLRLRIRAGTRASFAALFGAGHFQLNPEGFDGDGRFAVDWGGRIQYDVSPRLRVGLEAREFLVQGRGGGGLADFSPNGSAHEVTALGAAFSVPIAGRFR